MQYEMDLAESHDGRSWFVTLTISPKYRKILDAQVSEVNYEERCKVALDWTRDYLKRLRSALVVLDAGQIRFCAVTEPHYDGFPHIHLVLHGGPNLTYRMLRKGQWRAGFIHAQLADRDTAKYLTKYLTKQVGYVRASIRYGQPFQDDSQRDSATTQVEDRVETTTHDEGPSSCGPEAG